MHGNTRTTALGMKTRRFEDVYSEVEQAFDIHSQSGSVLGGVHFELTADPVTECTGGTGGADEAGLRLGYRSEVDPRLNYEQSLELAFLIAKKMRTDSSRHPKPE
jgi:3-deoxy-7-phosphoheptulonate synthase